ncbi:MAG: tetratricopeptide repeat protein, partial [Candidatus Omnitrophota bacterium]
MKKSPFKQKAIMAVLGVFFSMVLFEIMLRIGGAAFTYLQERRNTVSIMRRGDCRILCMGDSMTAGQYPHLLEEILNARVPGIKFSVIDRANVGTTSEFITARLDEDTDRYSPNMVIVMTGFNDDKKLLPYGNIPVSEKIPLKTYRLARILWHNLEDKKKRTVMVHKAAELSLNPDKVYLNIAGIYETKGDNSRAEEMYLKAIEMDDRNDNAYVRLAWFYRSKKRFIESREKCRIALEINPRNPYAYFVLGWCYKHAEDFDKSIDMFMKSIEIDQNNAEAYFEVGSIYQYNKKEYAKAIDVFKKSIEINPRTSRAYRGLAYCYEKLGEPELAERYSGAADKLENQYYKTMTKRNYQQIKDTLDRKGIQLVCVQYPMCPIEPLKRMLAGKEDVIFVDNER